MEWVVCSVGHCTPSTISYSFKHVVFMSSCVTSKLCKIQLIVHVYVSNAANFPALISWTLFSLHLNKKHPSRQVGGVFKCICGGFCMELSGGNG